MYEHNLRRMGRSLGFFIDKIGQCEIVEQTVWRLTMLILLSIVVLCILLYIIFTRSTDPQGSVQDTPNNNHVAFHSRSTLIHLPALNVKLKVFHHKRIVIQQGNQTFEVNEEQISKIPRVLHGVELSRASVVTDGVEDTALTIVLKGATVVVAADYVRIQEDNNYAYCHRDTSYVYHGNTVFNGVSDQYYVFKTRDGLIGKRYSALKYHEFMFNGYSYSMSQKEDNSALFCITELATGEQSVQRFPLTEEGKEIVITEDFRYDPVGVITIVPYTIAINSVLFDNKVHYTDSAGTVQGPLADIAMMVQKADGTLCLPTVTGLQYVESQQYYLAPTETEYVPPVSIEEEPVYAVPRVG